MRLVIGCNYHTTWQSHKAMRFVLKEIKNNKARLITTKTNKDFWCNIEDLIFINSNYNNFMDRFMKKYFTIVTIKLK